MRNQTSNAYSKGGSHAISKLENYRSKHSTPITTQLNPL